MVALLVKVSSLRLETICENIRNLQFAHNLEG
jgi:hypothetical protein